MVSKNLFVGVLVTLLVLLLVSIFLFYDQMAKKNELLTESERWKSQHSTQVSQNRQLAEQITGLQVLIGGDGYENVDQWPGNDHFTQAMKDKAERSVNAALTGLGEANRQYGHLVQVYDDLPGLMTQLSTLRDEAYKARSESDTQLVQAKQQQATTETQLRESLSTAQQSVADLEQRNEDIDNKCKEEKAEYVRQLDEAQEQCTEQIIALKRQINFLRSENGTLKKRIARLLEEVNKEKSFNDVEADGQLLSVVDAVGKGWIDIGRNKHLRKGIVFRVFQPIKGGKKLFKGRVEVLRVQENMSEVRIIEERDSLKPISSGDFISSPFYDPSAQPVFVFASSDLTSKDYTKEYLTAKMESYGAVISDEVDLQTDYVVATRGYEESAAYKKAREFGVTVIRERDLLEFIGR